MNAHVILAQGDSATRRPVYLTTEEIEAIVQVLRDVEPVGYIPNALAREAIADRIEAQMKGDDVSSLAWTTERPMVPGWYFVLDRSGDDGVLRLVLDDQHGLIFDTDECITRPSNFSAFAGPIPEPRDP